MTFTVVRAVRGADSAADEPGRQSGQQSSQRLAQVSQTMPLPIAPARMDLPFSDELVRLDQLDFAETVPDSLAEATE